MLLVLSARTRVSFIVYLGKMLEIKVSIYLSRADIGMAQQFLDAAQIAARLEQMGRKAVAKQVRVDALRYAGLPGPVADPILDAARADPAAPDPDKQCRLFGTGQLATDPTPICDGRPRLAPDRNQARLVAFTGDPHDSVVQIDIGRIEIDEFGES